MILYCNLLYFIFCCNLLYFVIFCNVILYYILLHHLIYYFTILYENILQLPKSIMHIAIFFIIHIISWNKISTFIMSLHFFIDVINLIFFILYDVVSYCMMLYYLLPIRFNYYIKFHLPLLTDVLTLSSSPSTSMSPWGIVFVPSPFTNAIWRVVKRYY